jgi:hypothetical protein
MMPMMLSATSPADIDIEINSTPDATAISDST